MTEQRFYGCSATRQGSKKAAAEAAIAALAVVGALSPAQPSAPALGALGALLPFDRLTKLQQKGRLSGLKVAVIPDESGAGFNATLAFVSGDDATQRTYVGSAQTKKGAKAAAAAAAVEELEL